MQIKWLCSCSRETKSIHDLNLCRKCHRISCNWCQKSELVVKFCSGCHTVSEDGNRTRCVKNCLECPRCQNQISVSADRRQNASEQHLLLRCYGCGWNHKLNKISEARAQGLACYFESMREKLDPKAMRFRNLQAFYNTKRKLEKIQNSSEQGILDTLDEMTSRDLARRLQSVKLFELINEEMAIPMVSLPEDKALETLSSLPRARRLRPKYNYRCPQCENFLVKVHPDPKSSRLVLESFAARQLPSLKAVPLATVIPSQPFNAQNIALVFRASETASGGTNVSLLGSATTYLPVREFTLEIEKGTLRAQAPKKDIQLFAARIPTYQLNRSSFALEQVNRLPEAQPLQTVSPSTENPSPPTEIIEKGNGWAIVPLYLLEAQKTHQLQLTVSMNETYVTFQTILYV
ncbi:LAME_0B06942g1_1 [Lachancea meyersii CBS 8951]|uniref:Dynactin subunit 4 n=1 Tax=Lachancea meyersii CBS 8951 TaxID=1266667 RepID=A0A1G4IX03_9SACH|nr:LAME_0B06942g1_1 [Lachancea meyersii CBS 8951]